MACWKLYKEGTLSENKTKIFVYTGAHTWFSILGILNNLYLASKLFRLITKGIWSVLEFEILHLQKSSWVLQQALLHSVLQQADISLVIWLLQTEVNELPSRTTPNIK